MTTPLGSTFNKLSRARRRRDTRRAAAIIDINADYYSRHRTGDPRIDMALVDRF